MILNHYHLGAPREILIDWNHPTLIFSHSHTQSGLVMRISITYEKTIKRCLKWKFSHPAEKHSTLLFIFGVDNLTINLFASENNEEKKRKKFFCIRIWMDCRLLGVNIRLKLSSNCTSAIGDTNWSTAWSIVWFMLARVGWRRNIIWGERVTHLAKRINISINISVRFCPATKHRSRFLVDMLPLMNFTLKWCITTTHCNDFHLVYLSKLTATSAKKNEESGLLLIDFSLCRASKRQLRSFLLLSRSTLLPRVAFNDFKKKMNQFIYY